MKQSDLLPAALPEWCGSDMEPSSWTEIVSSCTLCRNLPDLPFPPAARAEEKQEALRRVEDAVRLLSPLQDHLACTEKELESPLGSLLAERHLAPREVLHGHGPRALFTDRRGSRALIINALDHVSIRALAPGNNTSMALQQVLSVEETLGSVLDFSYDEQRGFLTSRLTCTGTGLKVCVLLHLPALTLMGLPKLYPGTAKTRDVAFCGVAAGSGLDLPHLGAPPSEPQQLSATPYMPVEPITEQCLLTEIEGFIPVPPEKSPGALYAVFNQHSLGVSEEEIAYGVYHAAREWCVKEEETRLTLLKSNRLWLQDWVGRAVALARGTHIAGFGEALDWISRIRLGAALGLLRMPGLTPAALNRMLIEIQAAHLANGTSEELSSRLHLARLRAEKLRAFLAQCEITAS